MKNLLITFLNYWREIEREREREKVRYRQAENDRGILSKINFEKNLTVKIKLHKHQEQN